MSDSLHARRQVTSLDRLTRVEDRGAGEELRPKGGPPGPHVEICQPN